MTLVWVDIHKLGSRVVHPRFAPIDVTRGYCTHVMANFQQLSKVEGYEIPLMKSHDDDGLVYGLVHDLRVSVDGWLQAAIEFLGPTRAAYNAGMIRKFSPGIAREWLHPHSGEVLKDVLVEVSFTSREYQTNLRPPQRTNPGVVLSAPGSAIYRGEIMEEEEDKNKAPATEPATFNAEAAYGELRQQMSAMTEQVTSLAAAVAKLAGPEAPAPEEEEDKAEMAALSARMRELEDKNTVLELAAAGVTENVDQLVKLRRLDAAVYSAQVKLIQKLSASGRLPVNSHGTTAAVGTSKTPIGDLVKLAAASGEPTVTQYLHKNGHADRVDEYLKTLG